MIDPATAAVLLKLADVAIVGFTAWQNAQTDQDDMRPGLQELEILKERIREGHITVEEADTMAEVVLEELMRPLDQAIDRL